MESRVNFYSIFRINPNGWIEPLRPVRIWGVQMSPGVIFGRWVSFWWIDLFQFIWRDFQVQEENGVIVLIGIYPQTIWQ